MFIHTCAFLCESILHACMGLCVSPKACDCVFLVECLLSGAKSQCVPVSQCLSAGLSSLRLHVLRDITTQHVSAVMKLHTVGALKCMLMRMYSKHSL